MTNNEKIKNLIYDGIMFLLGSLLIAISVNTFAAPNNIAPGGLTGLATLFNYLFKAPIGITTILLNIPLFIWGYFEGGYKFVAKTAVAMFLSSIMIDITVPILPIYRGNIFIIVVLGGVSAGFGLSLIFMRGTTTGGTDLAANLINRHVRHLSLGKLLLIIDIIIVVASFFVYKNIESPFYAIVIIYITTKVIDSVLYGTDSGTGKMMFIISTHTDEISKRIIKELDRGVTGLKSRGCYSGIEGEVLLCAVRRQEVYKTYDIVHSIDPRAFIIVGEAGSITGEGFKLLSYNEKKKIKNK